MTDATVTQNTTAGNGPLAARMTSCEVADLVEKRHDSVKRSIDRLANQGVITQPPTVDESYKDGSGRAVTTSVYVFTADRKRDTYVVVAQLSPEFTARIVDRWQELEHQHQVAAIPQDYAAALRAAADAWEREEALKRDNALLNTIIDNEFGYASILRAAKHLGVHEKTFKWQTLKKATLAAGLEVKRVPSPRYDYQNLYPISAFEQCYPEFDFSALQPEAVAQRSQKLLSGQVMTRH